MRSPSPPNSAATAPRSKNIEDIYPLSPMQEGMLFHSVLDATARDYFMQTHCVLHGLRESRALIQAWRDAVARHPVLRTLFVWDKVKKPVQVVRQAVEMSWHEEDWRGLGASERAERLERYLAADRDRAFPLDRAPLLRGALFRLADGTYQCVLSYHHLLLDGWSMALLLKEVLERCQALMAGRPAEQPSPRPYRDYILWLQKQDPDKAERFWRERLKGFASSTQLPTTGAATGESGDAVADAVLSHEETAALQAFCREHGLTLNTLVQGAWAILLSRYGGTGDVLFGATISGRPSELPGVEAMIGLFINTLPVRVAVDEGARLIPWLEALQQDQLECRQHGYSSLAKLQGWSEVPAGTPLFESFLVFENYPIDDGLKRGTDGLRLSAVRSVEISHYPLLVLVLPGDELTIRLGYHRDRFGQAAMARVAGQLSMLLLGMLRAPEALLADLPLLVPSETRWLLDGFGGASACAPAAASLAEAETWSALFEAQVRRSPAAPAILYEGTTLGFGELNARANRLAHELIARGIGPECVVGLAMARTPEAIAALLGIHKAGAAYLPLDPSYPAERLDYMVRDAGVALVLADGTAAALRTVPPILRLDDQTVAAALAARPDHDPGERSGPLGPDHLAYIVYTSGSTGQPKGVAVTHRGIANLIAFQRQHLPVGPGDRVLQFASLNFDASVWELCMGLLTGAVLVMAPAERLLPGPPLAELAREARVTHATLFPSVLAAQAEGDLADCRVLVAAGEASPAKLVQQWSKGRRFFNGYGPTEATVCATMSDVLSSGQGVPIGRPMRNSRAYVLDRHLRPVPIGAIGELYIAGPGLARGYRARPGLTAERFLADPFAAEPGARMYRTGDLALWREDGALEFLGRLDHQTKVRGFRIELGEIETALSVHPLVRRAVVDAQEHAGTRRLVGYVEPEAESAPPTPDALRDFLSERLPDYMVPSVFVTLERLPLSAGGKIDRRGLPASEEQRNALREGIPPRNETEAQLAAIWREVLRLPEVGVEDSFFALGGDSIISIQVVARARQAGLRLRPRDVFEQKTIAGLARIAAAATEAADEQGIIAGPVPITPIQHWFFERALPEPWHFNQALLLEVSPEVEPALLEQVLGVLALRHDMLRARYRRNGSTWQQEIVGPEADIPFKRIELSQLSEASWAGAIEAEAERAQASLDLERGPIWRALLFDLGPGRPGRLLLAIHHLAVDGVSWRILLEELVAGYRQLAEGKPISQPAKTASFRSWGERLATWAKSAELATEWDYWLAQNAGEAAALPRDNPGAVNTEAGEASVRVSLGADETRALLQDVHGAYNTRINDLLLAGLGQAVARWTGRAELLLDLEGHGREDIFAGVDLARTVGWFTTVFPLRLRLDREGPGEMLKSVKEQLRRIPRQGIGYGVLRYLGADPRRSMLAALRPELSFNYLGQMDTLTGSAPLPGLAPEPCGRSSSARGLRSHLLAVNAFVAKGCLEVIWSYHREIHRAETVERLAADFLQALRALIAHCRLREAGGYTPSDFPAARLNEQQLQRLAAKYGKTSGS
jgi:amino acid adenylation domain-containing protein/non-ribosomal peptide synthase protein (TIGR01720 family)